MKIIILVSVLSVACALRLARKTPSRYYNNDLFDYSPNDEYTLPKDFENDNNKAPVSFQGDVKQAKILAQENKNHGQGKFKYSLQTQNGIELTQVGKLKDEHTFVVSGSYSYTGADGKRYRVRYTADELGYHPITELDVEIPEIQPQAPRLSRPNLFDLQTKSTGILRPPVAKPANDLYNTRINGYNYDRPINRSPFPGSPQSPDKFYLPVF